MASASHVSLSRLLLQRSDQHPIRIIDGADLRDQPQEIVRQFLSLGVLVEREAPSDVDGFVIQHSGGRAIAVNLDGDGITTEVDAASIRQYDIDMMALCRQLRWASSVLEGRAVEPVGASAFWLGAIGTGSRRVEYFVARRLRPATALDVAFALKAHAGGLPIVVLTPTERDLPGAVRRQLDAADITLAAIDGLLDANASEPFTIKIPTPVRKAPRSPHTRLDVDVEGASARYDGTLLPLPRREFQVLVRLANERTNEDGWVSRDAISDALRAATASDDRNDEQIDKVVSNLRRTLRSASVNEGTKKTYPIETGRGQGYRLLIPPNEIHVF
jgi:DNA-binding winged helix-turn-helix (wHTH) protein